MGPGPWDVGEHAQNVSGVSVCAHYGNVNSFCDLP